MANKKNKTWIKSYRQLLNNPIIKKPMYCHLWNVLLLLAQYRTTRLFQGKQEIVLQPGQLLTGRKALFKLTSIPETTIERILNYLEREQQIGQQKTNKYRIITIKNWVKYQSREKSGQQNGQQGGHIQEGIRKNNKYYEQSFGVLWKVYPNKKGKDKALQWWLKNKPDETLLQTMLDAISRQTQEKERLRQAGKWFAEWPYGSTWLNGKRWEDEASAVDDEDFDNNIPPIRTPSEGEIEFAQKLMAEEGVK